MELKQVDLLALMPCPTKIPLERTISEKIREMKSSEKPIAYQVLSNAVMQGDIFEELARAKSLDELPGVMLAPGFSRFFETDFVEKFRNAGAFESVCDFPPSEAFRQEQICDPDKAYDIIAFNPLVLLFDRTRHPDLAEPVGFDDLLKEEYRDLVAFRGHDTRSFCEGVLFTIYKRHGLEGIMKLADSVKCKLHPSQMVRLAGSGSEEAPAISVIPLSFAQTVRPNPKVKVIWPSDGAIVNPLVMLTKKGCSERIRELAEFLISEQSAKIFQEIGFYSIRPNLEHLIPRSGAYQFVGWEFLKTHDVRNLLAQLNELMHSRIAERRGQV